MSVVRVNGVELFYEPNGSGEPLVLVHGSWGDHRNWDPVVGRLASSPLTEASRSEVSGGRR